MVTKFVEEKPALRADRKDLTLWSGSSAARGRYDYDSDTHRLDEICDDRYFGDCYDLLQKGDYITATDCEDQIMTLRVDLIDKSARKVFLSRIERLYASPVVALKNELPEDPGLVYRYRTPRAGGHAIMTAAGEVHSINYDTRTDAERAIARMYDEKIFEVPAGHEPVEPYVSKNTKVYKRA